MMCMKFKILSKETKYQGFFRIDVYDFDHELFAGGWVNPVRREVFERGNAVAVLLHDPKTDSVLMVEQFRAGAIRDPQGPWMIEIVAGIVEKGESLEDVARRESMEEAGCHVESLKHMLDYYPSAGGSTEQISLFYAPLDLSLVEEGIHGLPDEHEDIKVSIVPRSTAMQWIKEGKLKSSLAIIALQWLTLEMLMN
ncbi:MAG: ADP-ribose pyrophosphatase (EC [uncultured Thiotrichaceae bacterium]|uniref:ADP-ribose pyrophosphatase n=1 Tax=uncultured Thiotrichaceae bacterium TaxID=298394 RepID=A0A6S6TRP6_9GAMM|nr:MAG: ADP-ribose pyrophosphatase (EC [uncultured Thiotrichaceae bacterium]